MLIMLELTRQRQKDPEFGNNWPDTKSCLGRRWTLVVECLPSIPKARAQFGTTGAGEGRRGKRMTKKKTEGIGLDNYESRF